MNNTQLYLKAVEALLNNATATRREIIPIDDFVKVNKKLTLDSFITLLYSIFSNKDMLAKPEYSDTINRNKFIFTSMVPDYPNETIINNVVTYETVCRQPASFDSKLVDGKTTQYRPRYLYEIEDVHTNQMTIAYVNTYENEVKFIVWSEKMEDATRIAATIENFFVKYYQPLRAHLATYFYKGRSQTIVSSDYGKKRLFGIPLTYVFRTEEMGYLRQDEIINIDEFVEVANSSTALEELFSLHK